MTHWNHHRIPYGRAEENPESARSVIYAIFSAHSVYFNVSRQKVPYFNISRQKVPYFNVSRQNRVVFNCFATKQCWGIARCVSSLSFVICLPNAQLQLMPACDISSIWNNNNFVDSMTVFLKQGITGKKKKKRTTLALLYLSMKLNLDCSFCNLLMVLDVSGR